MFHATATRRLAVTALMLLFGTQAHAQGGAYRLVENWAGLPHGVIWGQVISVEVDAEGNVYAFHRCSADTCVERSEPPLLKFDPSGKLLMTWGEEMLVWPHGLHLDRDGNVWMTDARHDGDRGEQVIKLSPDGEVLMTLGTPGVAGSGPDTFDGVADVVVAQDGSIFVADGHINNRIVKFSAEGEFIMEWGREGSGPGEFGMPHALAMDSQGRLFVADRGNVRLQIFDQEGNYLDEWKQFGRPSGVTITADDTIYVASQNGEQNPGFETGIYVGNAKDGSLTGFIPEVDTESAAEGPDGVVYSGLVIDRKLQRFVKE